MAQRRAIIGGEVGANGEWFEGGKFIATTDHAKSHKESVKASRKQEIEPYKWEVPPSPDMVSIFRQLAGTFVYYVKATNTLIPAVNFDETVEYYHLNTDEINRLLNLMDKYNSGERWTLKPTNQTSEV